MAWKIVGTAAAAALALAACETGGSDRATSAAAARSSSGMSAAAPAMGGTPMAGGAVKAVITRSEREAALYDQLSIEYAHSQRLQTLLRKGELLA